MANKKETRAVVLTKLGGVEIPERERRCFFLKRAAKDGSWADVYNRKDHPTPKRIKKAAGDDWDVLTSDDIAQNLARELGEKRKEEAKRRAAAQAEKYYNEKKALTEKTLGGMDNRSNWCFYKGAAAELIAFEKVESLLKAAAAERSPYRAECRRIRELQAAAKDYIRATKAYPALLGYKEAVCDDMGAKDWMLWNACNQAAKNHSGDCEQTRTAALVAEFWITYATTLWDTTDKVMGISGLRCRELLQIGLEVCKICPVCDMDATVYLNVFDNILAEAAEGVFRKID